jgi:hypothetical protein
MVDPLPLHFKTGRDLIFYDFYINALNDAAAAAGGKRGRVLAKQRQRWSARKHGWQSPSINEAAARVSFRRLSFVRNNCQDALAVIVSRWPWLSRPQTRNSQTERSAR